jgi:hypothetical protein
MTESLLLAYVWPMRHVGLLRTVVLSGEQQQQLLQ